MRAFSFSVSAAWTRNLLLQLRKTVVVNGLLNQCWHCVLNKVNLAENHRNFPQFLLLSPLEFVHFMDRYVRKIIIAHAAVIAERLFTQKRGEFCP